MNEAARNNGECRIAVPDGALLSKFPLKGMRKMINFLPIYGSFPFNFQDTKVLPKPGKRRSKFLMWNGRLKTFTRNCCPSTNCCTDT